MRLPIYRRLDERLQILGLTLPELSILGGVYVLLAELLSIFSYGIFVALILTNAAFVFLLYLHRRHESHYIQKWIRFANLPDGLSKSIFIKRQELPLQ
jgi:hypothetical protein